MTSVKRIMDILRRMECGITTADDAQVMAEYINAMALKLREYAKRDGDTMSASTYVTPIA